MEIEELKEYISENIKTFTNLEIIENTKAYHYTSHFDKIIEFGRFLGAPINKDLDQTQLSIPSKPATSESGVVFAYLDKGEAEEEGFGCDVIEVHFEKALKALHIQEALLDAPDTIMILNTDITEFKKI